VRIKYCAAPCGSGKTHQIINRACDLVRNHNRVLILQPTRDLIDRTVNEELQALVDPPPVRVFHGGTIGKAAKVSKALADYVKDPPDLPEIVLATHQVLPHIKQFANKGEWHVLVDEALQAVRYQQHRIPKTHKLITDHLDVTRVNAVYGRVSVRGTALHDIGKNQDQDEILETLADTSRILANKYWATFVNLEQYERLKRGEGKMLAFHSVLKPEILAGFAEVSMSGANFEDSAIFKLWGSEGVEFEPDRDFAKGLRYSEHPNGDLVTIYYVTEHQWSRKRREAPAGDNGAKIQDRMCQAAKEVFPSGRFVWHANKSLIGDPFGSPAERLPNKPHGLNSFAGFDDIVFLSSLNPTTDHFRFLESRGLSGGEVRGFTYNAEAYQAIMRTSLRDPGNRQSKRILVPDRGLAEYLQDVFPGSKVEKLDIGLIDEVSNRRGRPRKHQSNRERVAQQRQRAREQKLKVLAEQIRLNSQDTVGGEDWGGNGGRPGAVNGGTSRAEISIESSYTIFGTGPLTATLFSSTSSSIPLGYVSGETEALIGFLHKCHERRTNSKDENFLFSPAIFDPDRSPGPNRGKANIAYLRHIVMDFEDGELRPDELPNLFPGLWLAVFNSFNHTSDKPRFRAVFPTSEIMTPEVYGLIQGCLADKLEDAGYSIARGGKGRKGARLSNSRPSGLDWSKSLPTSLFYLPCQAQHSGESFFHNHAEGERRPLQPATWLQNMTLPLQPGFEVVQADVRPPGVDEVLVQSAKDIWRGSKVQPGLGDEMFFNLAMSLRRAGMDFYQIESTLRSEAEFGRTPKERLSQIPSVMSSLRRYFVLLS
jgi:hypothetical protein